MTSKGQVTLPKSIRQLLGVSAGDRIVFEVQDARVVVSRAESGPHADPAIGAFLTLLEQDIRAGKQLGPLPEGLLRSMLTALEATPPGSTDAPDDADGEITGDVAL